MLVFRTKGYIHKKKWVFGWGEERDSKEEKTSTYTKCRYNGGCWLCVMGDMSVCAATMEEEDYPQATQSDGAAAAGRWNDSGTGSVC